MALVRKILEATLTAGQTSVSFTDSDIPNSLLRLYTTDSEIFPTSQTLSDNVLSVDFEAQASDMGVALEMVKQGLVINDTLTSDDTDAALSAKQGKALKTLIDNLNIPESITDLSDVDVDDIQNNQVLAWNSIEQKFKNVNQSGGGSSVTITPALLSGTKVADYSIDGVSSSLYAPDPGSSVTITPALLSGTKVADYSIDGVSGSLYAPAGGGSGHAYSTNEQVIGTWVDNKPLYETTFLNVSISTTPTVLVTDIDTFVNAPIINRKYSSGSIYTVTHCGVNTNNDIVFTTSSNTLSIAAESSSYNGGTVTCTVQYTKSTD